MAGAGVGLVDRLVDFVRASPSSRYWTGSGEECRGRRRKNFRGVGRARL